MTFENDVSEGGDAQPDDIDQNPDALTADDDLQGIQDEDATPTGEENQEQSADEAGEDTAPKKNGMQDRFSKMAEQRNKAREEAAYYKGLAEANAKAEQPQQQVTQEIQPPKEEDFESDADYYKAVARYEVRQEIAQERKQQAETLKQQKEQETKAEKGQRFKQQFEKLRSVDPDVDLYAPAMDSIPKAAADAILELENSAAVAVHVAKNPNLIAELSTASPVQAAMKIGRIEASIANKSKPKQPVPKPMTNNLGGSAPIGGSRTNINAMTSEQRRASLQKMHDDGTFA